MNQKILVFIIVVVVIAIAGYYYGVDRTSIDDTESKFAPLKLNYDVNISNKDVKDVDEPADVIADQQSALLPVPDLERPVVIFVDIPEETAEDARLHIAEITTNLKNNTAFFSDWIELGIYRKLIGDYEGTLEIWEYAASLSPQNPITYNNMANLYASYLRDYEKAEINYLRAIEVAPAQDYYYFAAFEFYNSILKDDKKAEDIVRQGIAANPSFSSELEKLLGSGI